MDVDSSCEDDSDCLSGTCTGPLCAGCQSNAECALGFTCISGGSCVPLVAEGGSCDDSADCDPNQNLLCSINICIPETCVDDSDCPAGGQVPYLAT